MADGMTDFVSIVGKGDALSRQVSDALMLLIREGGELGELERREIADPHSGERRTVKCTPEAWLCRLAKAAEVGAFTRHSPAAIAHRILTTSEET